MKNRNEKMLAWLAVIGAMLAISGCSGPAVVPAEFKPYKAQDGSFLILSPTGWEVESGGKAGYAWAKFTSGSAEISVDANWVGSMIADIAKSGFNPIGIDIAVEDRAPVAAVHEHERQGFEEGAGVQEKQPVAVPTGLSDARRSEFTGTRTFGGSIHGYRVTALSSDKRIRVVCQCLESEWEALKPAFDKVIESLGRGK